MFTRLAISVNCDHNWLTNSYGPPKRRTSIKDDTFAPTGNVASRAPDSSTIKSSGKGILAIPNYQRTSEDVLSSPLQFLFTEGFLSKSKTRHPGVSRPQSLVTGEMIHPLIVSQDLMRAMRQHRDILSTNPAIEKTRFATCIGRPSDKELTHFVCPPHLLHFECAL